MKTNQTIENLENHSEHKALIKQQESELSFLESFSMLSLKKIDLVIKQDFLKELHIEKHVKESSFNLVHKNISEEINAINEKRKKIAKKAISKGSNREAFRICLQE